MAAEQFGKNGFRATSYNQLLTRLGLGKGSAYYYFDDKQDLFLTVVRVCYRAFFDSLKDLEEPDDVEGYWAFVEAMTRRGLVFMREDPASAALLQCFARERQMLDLLSSQELFDEVERTYVDLVGLGQALGAVRRDVPFALLTDMARAISSAFDQWFIATAPRAGRERIGRLASLFTELSRRLLEPPPAVSAKAVKVKRKTAPIRRRP